MSRTLRSANSDPPTLWPTGREHLEAIANEAGGNPIPDLPNEESEESDEENMSGGAPAPAAGGGAPAPPAGPVPAAAPPEI